MRPIHTAISDPSLVGSGSIGRSDRAGWCV
jgi:hypothetical protein